MRHGYAIKMPSHAMGVLLGFRDPSDLRELCAAALRNLLPLAGHWFRTFSAYFELLFRYPVGHRRVLRQGGR